jgi:hypothetical protein
MPCKHIDERNYSLIGATNQKPLQEGQEMHPLGVNHGSVLLLFEPPPLGPPLKMK